MQSIQIGQYVGAYPFMNWRIFRLLGKPTTSAMYVAVFPASESQDLIEVPVPNQLFVPEAIQEDLLLKKDHPSLKSFFKSANQDTLGYIPLSLLPVTSEDTTPSRIFYYLYSLLKLEANFLIPATFDLKSVSLTENPSLGWYWIDNRLRSASPNNIDTSYLFELKQFFSSFDLSLLDKSTRDLVTTLQQLQIEDDSRTVTRQYLDACIDFAKQEVDIDILSSIDKWIDVIDSSGSIIVSISKDKVLETVRNQVLQDIMDLVGIEDVLIPPQILTTIDAWRRLGVDLITLINKNNLTTGDIFILQQVVDALLLNSELFKLEQTKLMKEKETRRKRSRALETILLHYGIDIPGTKFADIDLDSNEKLFSLDEAMKTARLFEYPQQYLDSWKIAYLYF